MSASPTHTDPFRAVEETLAPLTGQPFFEALARLIAQSLSAHCAFVAEFVDGDTAAVPLAFWCDGELRDIGRYHLAGTPCECVLSGDIVRFERSVAALFPDHRAELEAVDAESYLAIPLKTPNGQIAGHLAVIDRRSRDWTDADHEMLRVFAARATTELERRRFEAQLAEANLRLEERVADRTRELQVANARLMREIERERELSHQLEASEARYHNLFDNAPISIWDIDCSAVRARLEELRRAGVTDMGAHFKAHPEIGIACAQLIRIREVNRTTVEMYRAQEAAQLLDWTTNIVVPESYGPLSTAVAALARGDIEGQMDIVHRTVDGEHKHLAVRWNVPPGEEQKLSRILCCVVDVTAQKRATAELQAAHAELERRVAHRTAALSAANTRLRHEIASRLKAEEMLAEHEREFRDLYENSPSVHYSVDPEGVIRRANRQASKFFGCELAEIVGHPVWPRFAPTADGIEKARPVFERFCRGIATYDVEIEFQKADGSRVWGMLSVEPIRDAEGKAVRTRSVVTDITERKLAEQRLALRRVLEARVTRASATFASASSATLDLVIDEVLADAADVGWDAMRVRRRRFDGHIAEHVWRRQEYSLPSPGWFEPHLTAGEPLLVADSGELPDEPAGLRATLERAGIRSCRVIPLIHNERSLGALECLSFTRAYENGPDGTQLIGIVADLFAATLVRCAAEDELLAARQAAETASRAKSEFLANMSHELRTPLNAVLGYAQLLQRDTGLSATHLEAVRSIRRSGEHLLTLINDVLDLARIESGRLHVVRREVDLRALLADIDEMFRMRAAEARVRYSSDVASTLPARVWTDDRRLRQVLINLLGNAMKFTPAGAAVRLRVSAAHESHRWRVAFIVEDEGIGIESSDFDRIFEPFQQVGEERVDGVGLGLSITRQLVHAMGGHIELESTPGAGSTFTVTLELEATATRSRAKPLRSPTGYEGPRRRVLVADDRPENRHVLVELLTSLGFDVSEATDGATAVEKVAALAPDLVFTDLVMPVIDGFEAVRRMRRAPVAKDLKIVAISANAFEHTRAASLAAGCDEFLVKPLTFEHVLDVMERLLSVSWRYAEERPRRAEERASGPTRLPLAAMEQLLAHAHAGDIEAISSMIDSLSAEHGHGGIVARLRELAHRFDVRGIEEYLAELSSAPA